MSDINDRGQLMESLFFKKQDQELIEKIRQERQDQELRSQLATVSGVDDDQVLDSLIAIGVTADSLTALALIPLVQVAWADREMQAGEQAAILKAADSAGIKDGGSSYRLLAGWLEHRPGDDLLSAWKDYIAAVKENSDAHTMAQLKAAVLGKARDVAQAAGGFLGLGNKVSDAEQKVLADLEATLAE